MPASIVEGSGLIPDYHLMHILLRKHINLQKMLYQDPMFDKKVNKDKVNNIHH